jgi:hypothetical protein
VKEKELPDKLDNTWHVFERIELEWTKGWLLAGGDYTCAMVKPVVVLKVRYLQGDHFCGEVILLVLWQDLIKVGL